MAPRAAIVAGPAGRVGGPHKLRPVSPAADQLDRLIDDAIVLSAKVRRGARSHEQYDSFVAEGERISADFRAVFRGPGL